MSITALRNKCLLLYIFVIIYLFSYLFDIFNALHAHKKLFKPITFIEAILLTLPGVIHYIAMTADT